jgi:hypothetical protein
MFFTSIKQLKLTAQTIGAKPVGSLFMGMMSMQEHPVISEKTKGRLRRLVGKLI